MNVATKPSEIADLPPDNATRQRILLIGALQVLLVTSIAGVLGYLFFQLEPLIVARNELERRLETTRTEFKTAEHQLAVAKRRLEELESTQASILGFLEQVSNRQKLRLFDRDVNWEKTKSRLIALPAGKRKNAVFGALLLAWKEVPFKLGGTSVKSGIDSTRFMILVLQLAGVEVPSDSKRRPSEVMMSYFKRTTSPEPGDLMFFKGDTGSFVLMYLDQGFAGGHGVGIGTMGIGEEVMVLDSKNIRTKQYPFLGYWQVRY